MLQKTRGIILRNIKFKETSYITSIYTEKYGLLSFIINGVRSGKGAIKPSQIMPLTIADFVIYFKENANNYNNETITLQLRRILPNSSEEPVYKEVNVEFKLSHYHEFDEF